LEFRRALFRSPNKAFQVSKTSSAAERTLTEGAPPPRARSTWRKLRISHQVARAPRAHIYVTSDTGTIAMCEHVFGGGKPRRSRGGWGHPSHVDNGLGKTTELEYSTSAHEMLAAEQNGECSTALRTQAKDPGPIDYQAAGVDPWSTGWCQKMPTLVHVVKRVTESDNLTVAGRPPAKYITEYDYRDPLYEGRQREFRGFERARARRIGDQNSPTDISESTFLLGECADETDNSVDDCALSERWRDNPREALKGLPLISEKYDEQGTYL